MLRCIAYPDNNVTFRGNLESGLGLGLGDMQSFILTATDWSTHVAEDDVTAGCLHTV